MRYYNLEPIKKKNCIYSMIIGERSNGKSFAVLSEVLKNYTKKGEQGAIIRRWRDDFTGKRGAAMFDGIVNAGLVKKLTKNEWTTIRYWSGKWYLARVEEDKLISAPEPFCFGFSLNGMEHDKSTSYPNVKTILFDEFLTRGQYLPDEFVLFMNVLSTIIRQRSNVRVYMCANTVNKYAPYFAEMGLKHIKDQAQGTIDVYTYGETGLSVAVEICSPTENGKPSDKYFAFDNQRIKMITGAAGWEIDIYPHLTHERRYRPKDVAFRYFIKWQGDTLECEMIYKSNEFFTYIHPKKGDVKIPDKDLVFCPDFDTRINWIRNIKRNQLKISSEIHKHFAFEKVFYSSNEVGEIVRNYLNWCRI